MNQEELNQILENHRHWIKEDCQGCESMRANLCGANMCRADLCRADLRGANLCGADLRGADLRGADLYGADLRGADLYETNLYEADMRLADLRGADLRGANMHEADLCGADLYGAEMCRDNLCGAKNIPHITLACPSDGAFIGWKKARCNDGDIIVKKEIPEDAKRSSAIGYKCRCDKAKILGFYGMNGNAVSSDMEVWSKYDKKFKYRIGEIVSVENFDTDRFNECSSGIHFFVDRQSAIDYVG